MPLAIEIPNNYGLVLGAAVSTLFVNALHLQKVVKCRYKYGIPGPITVAGPEHLKKNPDAKQFDCAFRAHANYLENLPQFLFALCVAGLRYPVASAAATGLWIVGRMLYLHAYTNITNTGLTKRSHGFQIAIFTQLGVTIAAAYNAFTYIF